MDVEPASIVAAAAAGAAAVVGASRPLVPNRGASAVAVSEADDSTLLLLYKSVPFTSRLYGTVDDSDITTDIAGSTAAAAGAVAIVVMMLRPW